MCKFLKINRKRLIIFISTLLFLLGSAFAIYYVGFVYPKGSVPAQQNLPPVISPPLESTDLDVTLDTFGPWASPKIDENGHSMTNGRSILLLKEDGSIMESTKWQLNTYNVMWRALMPPEISRLSVDNGIAKILTNKRREFTVLTGQPFIFEQTPKSIYIINSDGILVGTISVDQALKILEELQLH